MSVGTYSFISRYVQFTTGLTYRHVYYEKVYAYKKKDLDKD